MAAFFALAASLELKLPVFLESVMRPEMEEALSRTLDLSPYGVTARYEEVKMDDSIYSSHNDTQDGRELLRPDRKSEEPPTAAAFTTHEDALYHSPPHKATTYERSALTPEIVVDRPRTAPVARDAAVLKRLHAF